jgi:hypothetical protein
MDMGLCYEQCKPDFKSDGATFCYKQYPDFEKNGHLHTVTSITKDVKTNTGRPLSNCPLGREKNGLLCYKKCRDGYDRVAMTCTKSGGAYGRGVGYSVLSNCSSHCSRWDNPCGMWHGNCKTCGWTETKCNCRDGDEENASICYPKCRPGFHGVGPMCHPDFYTDATDLGVPMTCKPGETEDSVGLCYDQCKPGYSKQSLGLCSQNCPAGSKDFGVGCTREAYNRGVGDLPFSMYMKKRLVPYGTKDGPSPAESMYTAAKSSVK